MNRDKGTIIVTGSSGFIGKPVGNRLAEQFNVVGFDREGPPRLPPNIDCVAVDLTSDATRYQSCA